MRLFQALTVLAAAVTSFVDALGPSKAVLRARTDNGRQDVVTWDSHSLMINGERVLILSGEVHPWRLPVPSLWLDVFQKVKALGFNAVSFYVHWGLVEYAKGDFNFEHFLDLQPFFDAATEAGIYLIARPGPYINAETTGGGTPGWGTRVPGAWRTTNATYLAAMEGYVRRVSRILAGAQITKGGPVILVQPENEYSYCFETPNCPVPWPQPGYMQRLQDLMHEEGITVPTITNEVQATSQNYQPGSGFGEVDMRGYDNYPLSFICTSPYTWPDGKLPTNFWELNHNLSGGNPNSVMEMQAGAHGRWGSQLPELCSILTGPEFERVIYKNYVSFSTTIANLYMMFGGTNWGGIASPATITSYDYGSPIRESRLVNREKYSELKLLAQFLRVSPAYLTTQPLNQYPVNTVNGSRFTDNPALAVTQLADVVGNMTTFWILRHTAYNALNETTYKLHLPTSRGNFSIPRLGGSLTLDGRDSKVHLTDYEIGRNHKILYSSGEVMTWKQFGSKSVVVLYGSLGELHETAFTSANGSSAIKVVQGKLEASESKNGIATLNYRLTQQQIVVSISADLKVVIVNRNAAYNYWVPEWDGGAAIVQGPYLVRSAQSNGEVLEIRGDFNHTSTDVEVFADDNIASLRFNGKELSTQRTSYGSFKGTVRSETQPVPLPEIEKLDWKVIDALPELSPKYDDSRWVKADLVNTTNPRKPTTPTSLYSSDYGFHTGYILWRGHFVATGAEREFKAWVQGGAAFAASIYLDDQQIAYFAGTGTNSANASINMTAPLSHLERNSTHVITVLQDHMGLEQNYGPGGDLHKIPRGILDYSFTGSNSTSVSWKVTGNLGGEKFIDRVRGPLNEGGLYPERQGFHQPGVDTSAWESGSPLEGLEKPGARFYYTSFDLDIPRGVDTPLAFVFTNTSTPLDFRAQLYINGYQFGKYSNNLGPQLSFNVPEGIINHRGHNTLALSLWGMDSKGAHLGGLKLAADSVVATSMGEVETVEQPKWRRRESAY